MQTLIIDIFLTILDCDGLVSALEDFGNSSSLSFKQFETYLSKEVFSCIGDSLCRKELSILEKQIDEACWQVSKAKLIADSMLSLILMCLFKRKEK
jgi:hypothetical protein